jgi:hypothetical protein
MIAMTGWKYFIPFFPGSNRRLQQKGNAAFVSEGVLHFDGDKPSPVRLIA